MPSTIAHYDPQAFTSVDAASVHAAVEREGWAPLLIHDPPGAVYPPHQHPEAKLLVFLRGSMEVKVGGAVYRCLPGDKLIIPGGVEHAALVGPDGCIFFWSEQRREVR
jgi:quercetin dioxygenase-like cupin family protein